MNKNIEDLNKKLSEVQEKQTNITKSISEVEDSEQFVLEIIKKKNRLFDRLRQTWHQDNELGKMIDSDNLELNHYTRKITDSLDQKRVGFLRERQLLDKTEEDVLYKRRSLLMEEK